MSWLPGYGKRRQWTVQQANLDSDLTNFPLLLARSNDADMTNALASGFDLRVTQSDGTTLQKYERDNYSGGGGSNVTMDLWTKAPSLASTGGATTGYLYWNKAGDSDGEDAANVWDASFVFVSHMNDASGNVTDSTNNAHHLNQTVGTPSYGQTGKIGNCMYFDGAESKYINDNLGITAAPFSWEGWMKVPDTTGAHALAWLGYRNGRYDYWEFSLHGGLSGDPAIQQAMDGSYTYATSSAGYSANTWHHIMGVEESASSRKVYLDGGNVGSNAISRTPDAADRFSLSAHLGSWPLYFAAYIDEVRVSNIVRSAAWGKFTYHNASEADNEITWGAVESASGGVAPQSHHYTKNILAGR